MTKGKFVLIEGPDGAGSTTQVKMLSTFLHDSRIEYLITKEPTDNLIGGLVRASLTHVVTFDPYTLQLLFSADRGHHLDREINPTLNNGRWVVTDRYSPSTIIYGAIHKGNDRIDEEYWNLLKTINSQFRYPDISLFLNINTDESFSRMEADPTRFKRQLFETQRTLNLVAQGYRRLASEYPNAHLIDANREPDAVHNDIVGKVKTIM